MTAPLQGIAMFRRPLAGLVVLLLLLTGCSIRIGVKPTAADEVRAQNLQLEKLVAQLQGDLKLRLDQVAVLQQQIDGQQNPMPGAEILVLTRISLDRYSGAVDSDGDKVDDLMRVYVLTQDQHGHMLPAAGKATLQIVFIPPDGAEPRILAKRLYDPQQWRQTYRSGLLSPHYTLEVKLPNDLDPLGPHIPTTVKVSFTHAKTGITFTTEQPQRIDR